MGKLLARVCVTMYLLTLPATHVFELHPWFPWPLVFVLSYVAARLLCFSFRLEVATKFRAHDIWLLLFLGWMWLSTTINLFTAGEPQREFSHLLSYIGVIGLYYFGAKRLMSNSELSRDAVAKLATVAFFAVVAFAFFEFLGKNFLGINIDALIPRFFDEEYSPLQGGLFIRPRAWTSESGNFALYLEILTPILVFHHLALHRWLLAASVLLLGSAALVLTFSAAGIASIFSATVLVYSYVGITGSGAARRQAKWVILGVIPLIIAVVISEMYEPLLISTIVDKLTFQDYSSALDRLGRWQDAIELAQENLGLGLGAGGFLSGDLQFGVVSWWLQILLEGGLTAPILLAGFFLSAFRFALTRSRGGIGVAIGTVAAALHYAVISDYWLPWVWFAIAWASFDEVRATRVALANVQRSLALS